MQPCPVVWGYARVSPMFCLGPDWAWPNCAASKQLDGYFAVWEYSRAANGASVIPDRMHSEGRGGRKPFSPWTEKGMDGTREIKAPTVLSDNRYALLFFRRISSKWKHTHTCKHTRWRKDLCDTVSIDRKFARTSSGNIRLISVGYNGAMCHRGVPLFLWPLFMPNQR